MMTSTQDCRLYITFKHMLCISCNNTVMYHTARLTHLHGYVQARNVKRLKHDLSEVFTILWRVQRWFSLQQQLLIKSTIRHSTSHHWCVYTGSTATSSQPSPAHGLTDVSFE